MAMIQHPNMDTLLAYLEAPEQANFRELRLHLAACSDCRKNIAKLHTVQNTLQQQIIQRSSIDTPSAQLSEALEQNSIERYVDGELQDQQADHVKALLSAEPNALKVALHYASHTQGAEFLTRQTAAPATVTSSLPHSSGQATPLLDRIKQFLNFRPPLWISASATAVLVLALATTVLPTRQASPDKGLTIATYQDKAVIHFQGANQLPGIGFFSKAHSSTRAFGSMKIKYEKPRSLSLQWPEVADAAKYHLSLFLITDGQKITVKEMDITSPQALITDFKPVAGKRYEWTLNGETRDSGTFYTSGGFVINDL